MTPETIRVSTQKILLATGRYEQIAGKFFPTKLPIAVFLPTGNNVKDARRLEMAKQQHEKLEIPYIYFKNPNVPLDDERARLQLQDLCCAASSLSRYCIVKFPPDVHILSPMGKTYECTLTFQEGQKVRYSGWQDFETNHPFYRFEDGDIFAEFPVIKEK